MKKEVKRLTPQALLKLMLYDWPGNVRELENTIEYAVAMTHEDIINEDLILQTEGAVSQEALKSLKEARDAFEKNYLIYLLEVCKGNVSKAARLAGKHRPDLYDLLKKHGLNLSSFKKTE
jgi:two-component system response regulator GlrR